MRATLAQDEFARLRNDAALRRAPLRVAAVDLRMQADATGGPLVVSRSALDELPLSATTDGLTGLANRSEFMTILTHGLRQRPLPALRPMRTEGEAEALIGAIQAEVTGAVVPAERLARVAERPQWDIVQRHLGS